jgi:glycine cleavage system T protein (aminomethyltransferase)
VTRTGYTGDLGYELWLRPQDALVLWDRLLEAGSHYGVLPAGIVPLDIARIEAGLFMLDVDYISSFHARIEAQKSSPFELGLGWAVALDGADFIGRKALHAEKARGSKWSFIGVAIDWLGLERLYDKVNLPPQVTGRASRDPVPLFKGSRQVGQITSRAFSPLLKKYIGIGTVLSQYATMDSQVDIEVTVEYSRERGPAAITRTPFYNPPHKKA